MNNEKNPIEDPYELLVAVESAIRKDIGAVIALYEHGIVPEPVSTKMIKSKKFQLALILKLNEELMKRGIKYEC